MAITTVTMISHLPGSRCWTLPTPEGVLETYCWNGLVGAWTAWVSRYQDSWDLIGTISKFDGCMSMGIVWSHHQQDNWGLHPFSLSSTSSHLRWWSPPKLWSLWSQVWWTISPGTVENCWNWNHTGFHGSLRGYPMWSGLCSTHLRAPTILYPEAVLSLLQCYRMDFPECCPWRTQQSQWSLHQLWRWWKLGDPLLDDFFLATCFPTTKIIPGQWCSIFSMWPAWCLRIMDTATFMRVHGQSALCRVIGFSPDRFLVGSDFGETHLT